MRRFVAIAPRTHDGRSRRPGGILLSDDAKFVTGQTLAVGGGFSLHLNNVGSAATAAAKQGKTLCE
jgi:hypothetical protein